MSTGGTRFVELKCRLNKYWPRSAVSVSRWVLNDGDRFRIHIIYLVRPSINIICELPPDGIYVWLRREVCSVALNPIRQLPKEEIRRMILAWWDQLVNFDRSKIHRMLNRWKLFLLESFSITYTYVCYLIHFFNSLKNFIFMRPQYFDMQKMRSNNVFNVDLFTKSLPNRSRYNKKTIGRDSN